MTSGFDSDHHMEWSVNMTRHEIANLSHRGNICTSWYGKRTIVRRYAKRRHGEKRQCESRMAQEQPLRETGAEKRVSLGHQNSRAGLKLLLTLP